MPAVGRLWPSVDDGVDSDVDSDVDAGDVDDGVDSDVDFDVDDGAGGQRAWWSASKNGRV